MDRLAGVLLIGILIAAWMMRWQIIPGSGTEGNEALLHFKLDRFTGSAYYCGGYGCYKSETDND